MPIAEVMNYFDTIYKLKVKTNSALLRYLQECHH
jgi:hypothetical protein